MKFYKWLVLIVGLFLLVGCSNSDDKEQSRGEYDFHAGSRGELITLVAGSENAELEPIIEEYAQDNQVQVAIDYLGSLDIMRLLQSGDVPYDAVWPASTIWLNMGDTQHILQHEQTTSITPVVFGIRQSLAEELGFVGEDVYIQDIMDAIESDKLRFAMTSATQSNSGASAYIGFLTALANNPDGVSSEDLANPDLQADITSLLSGVNRASGSSNWLVDLFLAGDYDAMVNYETLIIQTNHQLIEQGKEPLHLVYPVDGLSLSDSPLAFVSHDDDDKEQAFLDFQAYILSEEAQSLIEQTGKRSAYGTVSEANQEYYPEEWGIDLSRVLSPIRWPQADVIMEGLNLYQSEFKKPGLTLYVLDYSGSMSGEGYDQMIGALEQVLVPENAASNLLLPTGNDYTYLIPFESVVHQAPSAQGNGEELEALFDHANSIGPSGGTAMYEGIIYALDIIETEFQDKLDDYSPAIVVLTDGRANGDLGMRALEDKYAELGLDIPIFSITFGNASDDELEQIAQLTRARVFDGRENLIEAFQQVKGYN